MKKKQISWIIYFIALVLWLCLGIYNYERKKNLLENGIETIGVVEKVTMRRGRLAEATIWFRFVDVDNLQVLRTSSNSSPLQGKEAVIGGEYRVRYLAGKTEKTATIYIDEPVYDTIYDKLLF